MAKSEQRQVLAANIVGIAEIAERTGSTPHAVWNWTKRPDFPEPIATVSGKPAFDWAEVDTWNQSWTRSKGGFHTHKMVAKKTAKKVAKKTASKTTAKRSTSRPSRAQKETTRDTGAKTSPPAKRPARSRGRRAATSTASTSAAAPTSAAPIRRARRSRSAASA